MTEPPGLPPVPGVTLRRRPEVRLTRLGFGGAPVGDLYEPMSDADAAATVDAAWGVGIRYLDTAPHYGAGTSERRIGAAMAARPRPEWVISTKVGRILVADGGPGVRRVFDYTRDGVLRSLEESLVRLGLDRVDIVFVHDPDDHWETASREAVPALCRLRDEGVVGAVGVGMNQSAMLTRFVEQTDVDLVMCAGRYSLLQQPALEDLLPAAERHGVDVVAAGVFNSGLLAQPDVPDGARYDYVAAPEDVLDRARSIAAVCREHGSTLPAAALHFVLGHPAVTSAVLGMGSPAEALDDAALLEHSPPPELWADLVARGLLPATAPVAR